MSQTSGVWPEFWYYFSVSLAKFSGCRAVAIILSRKSRDLIAYFRSPGLTALNCSKILYTFSLFFLRRLVVIGSKQIHKETDLTEFVLFLNRRIKPGKD